MSAITIERPIENRAIEPAGFGRALRSEWIKLTSIRSTWWTLAALVVLGAGLTTLLCFGNAE